MTENPNPRVPSGEEEDEEELNMSDVGEEEKNPAAEGDAEENKTEEEEEKKKEEGDRKRRRKSSDMSGRGVCYLSRVPPRMDPVKLRHIFSQYGDVERIYLVLEAPEAQAHRKVAGGFRGTKYTEGWVEFAKKSIAKRVANMLNGEQLGGKRRSHFFYDIWNIRYLSKFKWDDLTEEIAYKKATRDQKLALEISAAKRERDFYLNKVQQSRGLSHVQERIEKKQKIEGSESNGHMTADVKEPKVIRRFPQNKPVENAARNKGKLSKDVLSGVFGHSSS